jgi:hypothetical protein
MWNRENIESVSNNSCYSAVKVIHKHISKLGSIFNWMHFGIRHELFPQATQLSHGHVTGEIHLQKTDKLLSR